MPKSKRHDDEEEEHVNHESWVIPYADMLTLLMGLFLVLWAIGREDLEKMKQFASSFRTEVGITQTVDSKEGDADPGKAKAVAAKTPPKASGGKPSEVEAGKAALAREQQTQAAVAAEMAQLDGAEQFIRERTGSVGLEGAVSFRREDRGLVVSIVSDDVLFQAGSADLMNDGRLALDALGAALRELPNSIAIEGHTDDRPISTGRFPSNWELSTARAGSVLRYLVDAHGLDEKRLVAGGYADQRPLQPNDTDAGRARNRRVDIAVLASRTPNSSPPDAGGG